MSLIYEVEIDPDTIKKKKKDIWYLNEKTIWIYKLKEVDVSENQFLRSTQALCMDYYIVVHALC